MEASIHEQAAAALTELIETAKLHEGQLIVIGCSSSEIVGERIGKGSTPEAANEVVEAIMPILRENGLQLAAQCCEHLNRALIVERSVAEQRGF